MGKYDELEKFKDLLDKGVITKADFEKQKEKILAQADVNETKKASGVSGDQATIWYTVASSALIAYGFIALAMSSGGGHFLNLIGLLGCIAAGVMFLVFKDKPKMQGIAALIVACAILLPLFISFGWLEFSSLVGAFFINLIVILLGTASATLLAIQYFAGTKEMGSNNVVKSVSKQKWFGAVPIIIAVAAAVYFILPMTISSVFSANMILVRLIAIVGLFGSLFVLSFLKNKGFKK